MIIIYIQYISIVGSSQNLSNCPPLQVKEIGKRVSAHLHGADIAGGVVRTVTGRRISTTSGERDGMQSLGLSPLDAFRSPVSMMASPWPDDEASYAYEEDETWRGNMMEWYDGIWWNGCWTWCCCDSWHSDGNTLFGRSTVEDRFKHGRKDQELVQSCISFLALRKKLASAVSSLTMRTFWCRPTMHMRRLPCQSHRTWLSIHSNCWEIT